MSSSNQHSTPDPDYSPDYQDTHQRLWHREAEKVRDLEEQNAKAEQDAETLSDLANALRAERDGLKEQLETLLVALEEVMPESHHPTCAALWEPPSRPMECDCGYDLALSALDSITASEGKLDTPTANQSERTEPSPAKKP